MAEASEERDFDYFMRWNMTALKDYLRKFGLSLQGKKVDLAARAFAAWEMKLEPRKTDAELAASRAASLAACLKVGDNTLPDPATLTQGWIGEKDGMKLWPPTMYFDICNFLGVKDMDKRLLADYKEGKAYSYFQADWLKEVLYHPINDDSYLCFLRADCTPSQNVRNPSHGVWVAVDKKSGEVRSACCNCFAGLGQTCNHVAALLFRLDHAWKLGYTQLACTAQECEWTKPKNTSDLIQPRLAREISWTKPQYGSYTKDKKGTEKAARNLFNPQDAQKRHHPASLEALMAVISVSAPSSVARTVWPGSDAHSIQFHSATDESILPLTIKQMAQCSDSLSAFLEQLSPIQPEIAGFIERETVGQGSNPNWKDQRDGRITASVFHNVSTRMATLEANASISMNSIIERVLGVKAPPENLPQLKYGREMEKHAITKFLEVFKEAGHKNVTLHECGVYVCCSHPYIGASPDAIIECACCGLACVEIKCPMSVAHTTPAAGNPRYLITDCDGKLRLSKSHKYWTQVQGQLGVTNMEWCYFFVFSFKGHCLVQIAKDVDQWEIVLQRLAKFFCSYLAPAIFNAK